MAAVLKNTTELKEAVETAVKAAEVKAAEAEQKVSKAAAARKPAAEKAVREATDKAVELTKKTAASVRKTVKKFEPKKTVVTFEAHGRSYSYDDIVKAVNKACKGQTAKKLEIYVNAEEGAAYYVLDGVAAPEYKVEL